MKTFTALLLLLAGTSSFAWDPIGDITHPDRIIRNVQREIGTSERRVEQAKAANAPASQVATAIQQELATKAKAAEELIVLTKEVDQARIQLIHQKEELISERDTLAKEKSSLERQRTDLEQRQRFYATGFYGSLFAAILAVLGILIKAPTLGLERRLLALQIEEKDLAIRAAKATAARGNGQSAVTPNVASSADRSS